MSAHVYTGLIDPLLSGVHRAVADRVPPGARVLDACCGPGALSRRLATGDREVLGIDLDASLVAFARDRAARRELQGLRYARGDVTALEHPDGAFDVVTITMGLHPMTHDQRRAAWAELRRVGRRVVAVDYAAPLPLGPSGLLSRVVERLAGREHHAGFRDFLDRGGMDSLLEGEPAERTSVGRGAMVLVVVEDRPDPEP